ncbi:MAG: Glu/Leu/Phe/Val dehydrogenase dimerization domain-containing protein [Nitrospinota bacterium]
MPNKLPANGFSVRKLPKTENTFRFSQDNSHKQEARFEVFDPATNQVWGFVTVDNTQRGPGLGGIRMLPDVSLNEVNRLAHVMTLKNSAACLPYGGGKSGLKVANQNFYKDRQQKNLLMEKWADALFEIDKYIPAADMGTDEYDVQIIQENHTRKLRQKNHHRGGSGRPEEYGGIPLDGWELTAHGLYAAALTLEELLEDFQLNNSKVVIQGFGNVGGPTAVKLNQKGALVVGASDIHCALWNPKGLDLDELSRIRKQEGGLSNYSQRVERKFDPKNLDWLLEVPCDILVPAARPDAITAKNIDRIDCRIILQGANTPSSKPVEYYLMHRKKLISLTDFIVNAGGVIGCAVERQMTQDKDYSEKVKTHGTRAYTENLIFNTVSKNVREIFNRIKGDFIFRDAATELALERINSKEIWL